MPQRCPGHGTIDRELAFLVCSRHAPCVRLWGDSRRVITDTLREATAPSYGLSASPDFHGHVVSRVTGLANHMLEVSYQTNRKKTRSHLQAEVLVPRHGAFELNPISDANVSVSNCKVLEIARHWQAVSDSGRLPKPVVDVQCGKETVILWTWAGQSLDSFVLHAERSLCLGHDAGHQSVAQVNLHIKLPTPPMVSTAGCTNDQPDSA